MSEHIVHTVLLNDSLALLGRLENITPEIKHIMLEYSHFAFRGCVTVSGGMFSSGLLEQVKNHRLNLTDDNKAIFAFTLGWLSHRACDHTMKPIWKEQPFVGRGTDEDPAISPTECSIYHEGEAYRRYLINDEIYTDAIFKNKLSTLVHEGIRLEIAEKLIQGVMAANLMQIQTINDGIPDQQRFEEICLRMQKFYIDMDRYCAAIEKPDNDKYLAHVKNINWYDENDDIIKTAHNVKVGTDSLDSLTARTFADYGKSYYAVALARSVYYMLAGIYFVFDDSASTDWLDQQLKVEQPVFDGWTLKEIAYE